jgi:hypothetical protein
MSPAAGTPTIVDGQRQSSDNGAHEEHIEIHYPVRGSTELQVTAILRPDQARPDRLGGADAEAAAIRPVRASVLNFRARSSRWPGIRATSEQPQDPQDLIGLAMSWAERLGRMAVEVGPNTRARCLG